MVNAGDEEGGIEMNTSIVLMREFCSIFKDEAPTTRIVSFSQPLNWVFLIFSKHSEWAVKKERTGVKCCGFQHLTGLTLPTILHTPIITRLFTQASVKILTYSLEWLFLIESSVEHMSS